MQEQTKKRSHLWRILISATLAILASGIVRALAIYIFVTPNEFAPGGINGIAVLLEAVTRVNSGYYLIALNVPLFFVAFFLLGKSEAIISTLSMLLTSGLLIVFDYIPGMNEIRYAPEYNAILASIAAACCWDWRLRSCFEAVARAAARRCLPPSSTKNSAI